MEMIDDATSFKTEKQWEKALDEMEHEGMRLFNTIPNVIACRTLKGRYTGIFPVAWNRSIPSEWFAKQGYMTV